MATHQINSFKFTDKDKNIYEFTQTVPEGYATIESPAFTGTPTAPTAVDGTNNTQIATTAFVMNAFSANDAMLFKGTIGSSGATVTALPATHKKGWTYKVATAGTYAGQACEANDTIICVTNGTAANDAHWAVVQGNIDGAVTGPASSVNNRIAVFNGTSGKVIKDGGYAIGAASAKAVDSSISAGSTSTNLPTSKAVAAFVEGKGYKTTDTNTTYSLTQDSTDGHKITLTPSTGTAQTITIPDNNTDTHRVVKVNGTQALASNTTALNLVQGTNVTITDGGSGAITIAATDTNTWRGIQNNLTSDSTTDSLSAAQGKALKALVDAKTSNTGTVTSVATGAGLTGGTITGSGTVKANLTSETKLTNASADGTETAGRVYPVRLDKNGKLAVNVPWENSTDFAPSSTVSCTAANVKSALGVGSGTTKYLREDGTWVDPRPSFTYNSTTKKLTVAY